MRSLPARALVRGARAILFLQCRVPRVRGSNKPLGFLLLFAKWVGGGGHHAPLPAASQAYLSSARQARGNLSDQKIRKVGATSNPRLVVMPSKVPTTRAALLETMIPCCNKQTGGWRIIIAMHHPPVCFQLHTRWRLDPWHLSTAALGRTGLGLDINDRAQDVGP